LQPFETLLSKLVAMVDAERMWYVVLIMDDFHRPWSSVERCHNDLFLVSHPIICFCEIEVYSMPILLK